MRPSTREDSFGSRTIRFSSMAHRTRWSRAMKSHSPANPPSSTSTRARWMQTRPRRFAARETSRTHFHSRSSFHPFRHRQQIRARSRPTTSSSDRAQPFSSAPVATASSRSRRTRCSSSNPASSCSSNGRSRNVLRFSPSAATSTCMSDDGSRPRTTRKSAPPPATPRNYSSGSLPKKTASPSSDDSGM